MKQHFFPVIILLFCACNHNEQHLQKKIIYNADTSKQHLDSVENKYPSFKKAHINAKALMNEDFYFSPIDETAPFGNDDGSDAYAGFVTWRQSNKNAKPKEYFDESLERWGYPKFDIYETGYKQLLPFLKQDKMSIIYMTGTDAAIIAIAFGQLYLEGVIDKDFNELAKTAIKRELIPELLTQWGEKYKKEREEKLKKMLAILSK
jgi:uncharacterized protein YfeS